MACQHEQRLEVFWAYARVLKQVDRVVLRHANGGVHAGRLGVSKVH